MSAFTSSSGFLRLSRRLPLFRRAGKARRASRLDVGSLSGELLRDLGFLDGHPTPPRDSLRD